MPLLREVIDPSSIRSGYSPTLIAKGLGVRFTGAAVDQVGAPSAITDPRGGVVHTPIPAGGFGDVVLRGLKIATAGAAIARGARVECGTNGRFVTRTTGTIWGVANTAAAADGDSFELELATD